MTAEAIIALVGGIVGVLASICAIVAFVITRKKEGFAEGKDDGEMKGDIKYIRNNFDDLRLDVKELKRSSQQQEIRLARVEESVKSAHKRIDEIHIGGHNHEDGNHT